MKAQLKNNSDLLLTFFNVMILSKAFKLDKLLQTNSKNNKNNNYISLDKLNSKSRHDLISAFDDSITSSIKIPVKKNAITESKSRLQKNLSINIFKTKFDSREYEGDAEQSTYEVYNESTASTNSRYDLILFPRILELCLNYIISVRQQQRLDLSLIASNDQNLEQTFKSLDLKYDKFNANVEHFFKRLLYLLESCNLNIQTILNNVSFS